MSDFPDIVYPDSPFLPKIKPQNIVNINHEIMFLRKHPVVAIGYELARISLEVNKDHNSDLDWILKTFNTDILGIDLFMFGYTMAPSFFIGCHLIEVAGVEQCMASICPPPKDDFLESINKYKTRLLPRCYRFYLSGYKNPPHSAVDIFEIVKSDKFSNHKFFLAGIEASEENFNQLCPQIAKSVS